MKIDKVLHNRSELFDYIWSIAKEMRADDRSAFHKYGFNDELHLAGFFGVEFALTDPNDEDSEFDLTEISVIREELLPESYPCAVLECIYDHHLVGESNYAHYFDFIDFVYFSDFGTLNGLAS